MKKALSKLERVPLREAWKHEANDFTPWLAEEDNLNTLADALGLPDLELVAAEHWVGELARVTQKRGRTPLRSDQPIK
jgi:hypothetical protein